MGVAEKRNAAIQIRRHLCHVLLGHHVFIFIKRRAMENLKAVDPIRALCQAAQVFACSRVESRLGSIAPTYAPPG